MKNTHSDCVDSKNATLVNSPIASEENSSSCYSNISQTEAQENQVVTDQEDVFVENSEYEDLTNDESNYSDNNYDSDSKEKTGDLKEASPKRDSESRVRGYDQLSSESGSDYDDTNGYGHGRRRKKLCVKNF